MRTTARAAPALAAFLSTLLLMPWAARVDRPFISMDAAVADQREVQIELGYFTREQSKGGEHVSDPELGPVYGVWKNTEVVGEFLMALPGLEWVGSTSCDWPLLSGSPFPQELMPSPTAWVVRAADRMDCVVHSFSPHWHKPGPPLSAPISTRLAGPGTRKTADAHMLGL